MTQNFPDIIARVLSMLTGMGGRTMSVDFWDLFWTTGMPEAWLMSRGEKSPVLPGLEPGRKLSGPPNGSPYPPVGGVPGNPNNLY